MTYDPFFFYQPLPIKSIAICHHHALTCARMSAGFCLSGPAACVRKHMKCVSRRGGGGGGAVDGKWRVSMLTLSIPINHNSPFKSTGRKLHFPHPRSAPRSAASPVSILISRLNDCNSTTMIHGDGQQLLCPFQVKKGAKTRLSASPLLPENNKNIINNFYKNIELALNASIGFSR